MRRIWRRWPHWVGHAAAGCAAVVVVTGVAQGGAFGWAGAVAGVLGLAGVLARRPWLSRVAVAALAVTTFGLLQELVTLLGTGTVDDWPGFLAKCARTAGLLLLAGAALAAARVARGACGRCGYPHPDRGPVPLGFPEPSAAPRGVRWAAYAGMAAFAPYAAMKVWFGLEHGEVLAEPGGFVAWLARLGVDLTAVLATLGVFLLFAMTRPWSQVWPRWTLFLAGRHVPRWLPLVPAWLGATLGPYGFVSAGFLLVNKIATDMLWVAVVGLIGFTGSALAFAVVAWNYQRRTRPRCLTPAAGGAAVPAP